MTAPVLLPLQFEPPLQNPSPYGLFAATDWQVPAETGDSTEGDAVRHLNGVDFRPVGNYGGAGQSGIWPNDSCATGATPAPGLLKEGLRTAGLDTFDPNVLWAYDECDLTEQSRAEVRTRVSQVLRLQEQLDAEAELAARMIADAGVIATTVTSLAEAVGYLEGKLAQTNTVGFIHIGAQWVARDMDVFVRSGTTYRSPLGHLWVIGGGYVAGLADKIIVTSPTYGWRDDPTVRDAIDQYHNTYSAIAERTVLVGYEHLIAAVQIDTTP